MAIPTTKDTSLWSWSDVNGGYYQNIVDNYTL